MRPTQQAARAGETFGPYQLVRQLAVGGMAEIYLARATGLSGFEKFVALKMIHPNYAEDSHFIDMLVEEAKIVVHLTQPNIVQIFDLGRIGDVHYIAMEYVDGLDLYHVLRAITEVGELLDFDVAAYIALEICAALDYAHRCRDQLGRPLGIIHRDISPQNILLSKAGEVKLADFGIAKASVRARQTAVGVIKGKYYYMSPEQAWGDAVDHRTDLFSTGVVLYESIVGQMLYLDEDLGVLLDKVRKAEIAPPSTLRPGVPRALEDIVLRAVARRPEDRFQSAHEFQLALQQFLWSYAPHFNLGRVRDAVLRAAALEDKKRVFDLGGPGSSVGTAQIPARPRAPVSISFASHSLLPAEAVRTGEKKLASLPDWGDDYGEATVVSQPPLMLAHLGPGQARSPSPPPILPISVEAPNVPPTPILGWDEADETTTVASRSQAPLTQGAPPPIPEARLPAGPGLAGPPEQRLPPLPASAKGAPIHGGPTPALGDPPLGSPVPLASLGGPVPPPTYQADPFGAYPFSGPPPQDEADLAELQMAQQRRRRLHLGLGIGAGVLLLGIVLLIFSARKSLENPGSVLVESEPTGARVFYKGKAVGTTPHRLDSLPLDEEHSVRLEHPRCESTPARLPVEAGKTRRIRVPLRNCDK